MKKLQWVAHVDFSRYSAAFNANAMRESAGCGPATEGATARKRSGTRTASYGDNPALTLESAVACAAATDGAGIVTILISQVPGQRGARKRELCPDRVTTNMPQKTALYDLHVAAGAKLVDFAGWDMPVQYTSLIEEHEAVRASAGMFDVSHMTAVDIRGPQTIPFLRRLLANDVAKLELGKAMYSCMLAEDGGVIDDLISYYMAEDWFRSVVNAGTTDKDIAWIQQQAADFDVEIEPRRELCIIAVQGPQAREQVATLLTAGQSEAALALTPFSAADLDELFIGRTGYTGEDGFEIILPAASATSLWQQLLDAGVKPCGLGARDTLRLEAGMNLYGQDMDESTHPLESGLGWTVALEPEDRDFIGRAALEKLRSQSEQKMVGLLLEGRGVLRAHQAVTTDAGRGEVTSGTFSPTMRQSIGLARVPAGSGEQVNIDIRGKAVPARVVKPPFVRNGKILVNV